MQLPVSGIKKSFAEGSEANQRNTLLQQMGVAPDVALRKGDCSHNGWTLKKRALKDLIHAPRAVSDTDFTPVIRQKGVDIRLALDMAMVAIKHQADVAVLIAGDTDFVPIMKLARREGLRVYLDLVEGGGRDEMREHADFIFMPLAGSSPRVPVVSAIDQATMTALADGFALLAEAIPGASSTAESQPPGQISSTINSDAPSASIIDPRHQNSE